MLGINHINKLLEEIKLKQSELAADLRTQTDILRKIGNETGATLQKVADLETAINNSDTEVSEEVKTALADLKGQAQKVDDLVPDLPAATAQPAGQPAAAQTSTVVSDAVAQAAGKATTALGEVQEAITAGGDLAAAVDKLETAHAEIAGVNDNDTSKAEEKLAEAMDDLTNAGGADEQKAALPAVVEAHNELIVAASAAPADGTASGTAPVNPRPQDGTPEATEWDSGVAIQRRGDALPDAASDSAKAGFAWAKDNPEPTTGS